MKIKTNNFIFIYSDLIFLNRKFKSKNYTKGPLSQCVKSSSYNYQIWFSLTDQPGNLKFDKSYGLL
jgi:hypothetical protein